ncbi:hypothetical protein PR003_g15614 [Phytophthora rubi]|uniref:Uncharacterized protein n=1 Tax=Phytophthora rubi TaxID=129364 RepID=A0A6A4EXT2_9STRA|nr:hypothetical protein PR003_g15614 [Phytophthora rubi]
MALQRRLGYTSGCLKRRQRLPLTQRYRRNALGDFVRTETGRALRVRLAGLDPCFWVVLESPDALDERAAQAKELLSPSHRAVTMATFLTKRSKEDRHGNADLGCDVITRRLLIVSGGLRVKV